jgi:hypothetical protein
MPETPVPQGAAMITRGLTCPGTGAYDQPFGPVRNSVEEELEMLIRRSVALFVAVIFIGNAPLSLVAQEKKPKLTKEEQKDEEALTKLVNAVSAGQPAPTTLGVTWLQEHFLKLTVDRTYSAFTVNVSGTSGPLSIYVRAMPKGTAGSDKDKKVMYPAEHLSVVDAPADGRVSRAVNVPAGEYDVYVAVKEKATGKKNEVNKTAVLKKTLAVPDFTTTTLTTSSVILASSVEGTQPLAPEQAPLFPYTLGGMKITPAGADGKFSTASELNLLFWIYGATPVGVKPDVQVEYNFHQRLPEGEKYFNKTAPQMLNAQSLPPEFDLSTGVLLMTSQSLPLKSFPPGDYRLEIKITDKPSGKSVTQNVNFTVTA